MALSTGIETLPPEIQIQILKSVPDLQTLNNLVSASARVLQVYKASKKAILSHMVHVRIHPELLPLALDCLALGMKRSSSPNDGSYHAMAVEVLQRLGEESSPSDVPRILPIVTSRRILHFHELVEEFVVEFTQSRITIITEYLDSEDTSRFLRNGGRLPLPPPISRASKELYTLSETEHFRLTRAFYHLQLWGTVYSEQDRDLSDWSVEEMSDWFLGLLRSWEFEELLCVWNFLQEKHIDFLDQVEDDLVQQCNDLGDAERVMLGGPAGKWYFEYRFFDVDYHHSDWHQAWVEVRLSQGLKAIRALLAIETAERRIESIGEVDATEPILNDRFHATAWEEKKEWSPKKLHTHNFHDCVEAPNISWLWIKQCYNYPETSRVFGYDITFNGLRRLGGAIWDHARMKKLGILLKGLDVVAAGCERDLTERRSDVGFDMRIEPPETQYLRAPAVSARNLSIHPCFGSGPTSGS